MKYKVGDRVKVLKYLIHCNLYDGAYFFEDMDRYEGKIVTIDKIDEFGKYRIKEDNGEWAWTDGMFEPITNWEKAREEMELGEIYMCKAICRIRGKEDCNDFTCGQCKEWLEQPYVEKEILDKIEKEYLTTVIKPFRNKVKYITKDIVHHGEFISIGLKKETDVMFPYFKEGTMYKGMKLHKHYTLEELNL